MAAVSKSDLSIGQLVQAPTSIFYPAVVVPLGVVVLVGGEVELLPLGAVDD
jgi:hypothetical protein